MNRTRAIFAGGVSADFDQSVGWRIFGDQRSRVLRSLPDVAEVVGSHAIAIKYPIIGTSTVLLSTETHEPLGFISTEIDIKPVEESTARHFRTIAYILGATVYHCATVADRYCETAREMHRNEQRLSVAAQTHAIRSGVEEIYYDFEACVTRARRLYDLPCPLIWARWRPDGRGAGVRTTSKGRSKRALRRHRIWWIESYIVLSRMVGSRETIAYALSTSVSWRSAEGPFATNAIRTAGGTLWCRFQIILKSAHGGISRSA